MDTKRLRLLAGAATPGPWKHELDCFDDMEGTVVTVSDERVKLLATLELDAHVPWQGSSRAIAEAHHQAWHDAAFIAACSPEKIVALCDALDAERERAEDWKGHHADAQDGIARLLAERNALQRFKDYVHQRLDEAGVPIHPDGPHSKAGCRVGDRLDIALGAGTALVSALGEARIALIETRGALQDWWASKVEPAHADNAIALADECIAKLNALGIRDGKETK